MPMVSLKLMAGAARSMVVAFAITTAAEITVRACGGVQGRSGGEDRELGTREGFLSCLGGFPKRRATWRSQEKASPPKNLAISLEHACENRHNGLDGKNPFNCMIALRGH